MFFHAFISLQYITFLKLI